MAQTALFAFSYRPISIRPEDLPRTFEVWSRSLNRAALTNFWSPILLEKGSALSYAHVEFQQLVSNLAFTSDFSQPNSIDTAFHRGRG